MKKAVATAVMLIMGASPALAAEETITLKASNGNVTFNHKQHQERQKSCKPCHEKAPGKIEAFGKDAAHKLCRGCHESEKKGPTKCAECHKK